MSDVNMVIDENRGVFSVAGANHEPVTEDISWPFFLYMLAVTGVLYTSVGCAYTYRGAKQVVQRLVP